MSHPSSHEFYNRKSPSPYKLHLHRAMQGVPINWIALTEIQHIAAMSTPLYDVLTSLRSGRVDELLPKLPAVEEWHRLYADHRQITQGIGNSLPSLMGADGVEIQEGLDFARNVSRIERQNPGEISSELLRQARPHKIRQFFKITQKLCHRA